MEPVRLVEICAVRLNSEIYIRAVAMVGFQVKLTSKTHHAFNLIQLGDRSSLRLFPLCVVRASRQKCPTHSLFL